MLSVMSHYSHLIFILAALCCINCEFFDVELREGRMIKGNGQVEFDLKVKRANKTINAVSGDMKIFKYFKLFL